MTIELCGRCGMRPMSEGAQLSGESGYTKMGGPMNQKCTRLAQPIDKVHKTEWANEPKLGVRSQSTKVHKTEWANEPKCALPRYSELENEYWGARGVHCHAGRA